MPCNILAGIYNLSDTKYYNTHFFLLQKLYTIKFLAET